MLWILVFIVLSISAESLRIIREPDDEINRIPGRGKTHVDFRSLMNTQKDGQVRFAHIPKAGGTFVQKMLRVLGFRTTESFSYQIDPNFKNRNIRCAPGHVPPGEAIGRGDSERSKFFTEPGAESFAVIRHPYARAVSQWTWGLGQWHNVLGYPDSADGMNRFLQDALKNASKTNASFHFGTTVETAELNGPYLQDCHFVPQVDYVFNKNRTLRVIKTLLNFSTIEEDLFNLLERHSRKLPAVEFRRLTSRTADQSTVSFKYETNSKQKVTDWLSMLTDETRDALDRYYAEDFDLMGFSKYRSK